MEINPVNKTFIASDKEPKETKNKPEVENKSVLTGDKLELSTTPKDKNVFSDPPSGNGWKVKSVHLNAGYMLDNNVIHNGPLRIVNQQNGTDVTITGYQQIDRKSWQYLDLTRKGRFAPDEPQFDLGVNVTFENNFGLEIDGKHNKIIMDGYDQNVHFNGVINGQSVNQNAPLGSFIAQHENTYQNMQFSAMGTYTFDLPAPADHRFSFITKAGPSLIATTTHSRIKNPSGEYDNGTSKMGISGYGGIVENGLRYQFGPKTGRLGIEATHSLSYLNYSGYQMVGGSTGSHSATYSTFALKLTVGLFGNK